MKLELADFPVRNVRLGTRTGYANGVLSFDKEELLKLVLNDKRIASADLDVAFPDEQTRIVNVRDVVEPRVKVSGRGCVFPGILGPVETVGEGRTHRLSGVTVIASGQYRQTIPSGTAAGNTGIVDMWGPASRLTPLGSTLNIVLILKLIDGVSERDAHSAFQMAEFRVAQRLAETIKDKTPESTEVFELFKVDPSLPRVVYIFSFITFRVGMHQAHSSVELYGLPVEDSLPTFIHPNELLDGALTRDSRRGTSSRESTWGLMNNSILLTLYREHGKRLNFLGVILQRTRFLSEFGKHVTAEVTSQMARLLGADGAVTSRTSPSGNNMVEVMLTLKACERKGVKTVMVGPEWGGREGTEPPLAFHLPEADAIVSTCSLDRKVKMPAPAKVIGLINHQFITINGGESVSPWSELLLDGRLGITEGLDWFGRMNYACKVY